MRHLFKALAIITVLGASNPASAALISVASWLSSPITVGDKTFTITQASAFATCPVNCNYWGLSGIGVDIAVAGADYTVTIEPLDGSSLFIGASTTSYVQYDFAYSVNVNDPNYYIIGFSTTNLDLRVIGRGGEVALDPDISSHSILGVSSIATVRYTEVLSTIGPAIVSTDPYSITFYQAQFSSGDTPLPEPGSLALFAGIFAALGMTKNVRGMTLHKRSGQGAQ